MKHNAILNMLGNEIQNFVIQNLTGAPSSPKVGQPYLDTTGGSGSEILYIYIGTGWMEIAFITRVLTKRLDQFAAPNTSLSMASQKIINLLDPTSAQDAATKNYVDQMVNGTDWKQSVRVISTANITLSGTQTIDGVSVIAGDRVLVTGQTTASANGIYIVAAGAWSRATDADGAGEITANMATFVEEGTTYADTQWRLTTNNPITIGTTSLVFQQFGAASTYTNGLGITLTGNVFALDTAVSVRKYSATFGDGVATSFNIDHNLNSSDPTVTIRKVSNGEPYVFDYTISTANRVIVTAPTAPASNEFSVSIKA